MTRGGHRGRVRYHWRGQRLGAVLLAVASLVLGTCSSVQAQSAREVAKKSFPSVVLIVAEDSSGASQSLGSGFFVRPDVIATSLHVVKDAAKVRVRKVGESRLYPVAGVLAYDADRDLALLKVVGVRGQALPLGGDDALAMGDDVYALGNPEGFEGTFSRGNVSAVRKVEFGRVFQITAPISQGSSGGPILNVQGQVVGVAFALSPQGQNLNFAIPVTYLRLLLAKAPGTPMPATATRLMPPRLSAKERSALWSLATEVVRSTRDYRASLERLLAIYERDVGVHEELVSLRRDLMVRGVVTGRELAQAERLLAESRANVDETRRWMKEADQLIEEATAAYETIPQAPK